MIGADTHSVLWLTRAQHLLSPAADRALAEASEVAISDMTLWEVAMMVSRKRVLIDRPLDAYLRHIESEFVVLPITGKIAERAMQFSQDFPRDPADRIIAATALVHGIQLVTGDAQILASKEVDCIW